MSASCLQSSWIDLSTESTGGGGGGVPQNLSVQSLSVSGVPVNGLSASGVSVSAQTNSQFVPKLGGVPFTTSELIINRNEQTGVVQLTDVILPDEDGNWEYTYPIVLQDTELPTVSVASSIGGVPPVVSAITAGQCAGVQRFSLSSFNPSRSKLLINVLGLQSNEIVEKVFVPPALPANTSIHPMPPQVFDLPIQSNEGWCGFTNGFTPPADYDPTKVAYFKVAWATTTGYVGTPSTAKWGGELWLSPSPNSFTNAKRIGAWGPVPPGVSSNGFATQPYNQYITLPVLGLTPNTPVYFNFFFLVNNVNDQTVNFQLDVASFTYYSTTI